MNHIFYFLAIFAIIWESLVVTNPRKVGDFVKSFRATKDKTTMQNTYSFFALGYILWIIIGFFSSQWVLFLAMFLMSYIIPKRWVVTRFLDALISLSILIFMVINVYHLHIDVHELVKQFLYK
jgi:energy-coupling factor transporter transmembrane protein EcfT